MILKNWLINANHRDFDLVSGLQQPSLIFNNLVFYVHQDECPKRERCFEGVWIITLIIFSKNKNKKRGFPNIIDEDKVKKIEGLDALKEMWNAPSEDKKIDLKYYKLLSDSLINYRQELLKSIDLTQGDVQGLKDPFLETELELKLVEEVRRLYNMEQVVIALLRTTGISSNTEIRTNPSKIAINQDKI